jgi:gliding motility associated protien GldN
MKTTIHKVILCSFLMMVLTLGAMAQVLDGIYVKEHFPTRKVVPYSHLREADVMWSKRIWRVIPLNEKINQPLKLPLHNQTNDRKSLIDVIFDAAIAGDLTAYYGEHGEEFAERYTPQEIKSYGASDDTVDVAQPDGTVKKEVSHREFNRDDVIKYRVKEDWFFDKQRSVMDVRIIGIAPVVEDTVKKVERVPFWIYFPEARHVFVNKETFNRFNDAERRTFDDIFFKRIFNSYIIKEANVEDRRIKDYAAGLDALLESQRIKEDLFNLEHDVWEL